MSYYSVSEEEVKEFEECLIDNKCYSMDTANKLMEFAAKVQKTYKKQIKKKALVYQNLALDWCESHLKEGTEVQELKMALLKRRANTAKSLYDDNVDKYTYELLRILKDMLFDVTKTEDEQKEIRKIMTIYEENLTDSDHWKQEIMDHMNVYRQFKKPSLTKESERTIEELEAEAQEARDMFEAYEEVKMNVRQGQKFYIASMTWIKKWKAFIGFDGDVSMEAEFPGPCNNEDIIDNEEKIVICDVDLQHLNTNLKDNLREDDHFMILNEQIWKFLSTKYGGREMLRFGQEDSEGRTSIEVYLQKVYVYFFPMSQANQHIDVLYSSKNSTLEHILKRMMKRKGKNKDAIRFWKHGIPQDLGKFYRDILCEWKKYKKASFHGERLKALDKTVEDVQVSRDDMLVIEMQATGGFIFEEVEEVEHEHMLHEEAKNSFEAELADPQSLKYLDIPLKHAFQKSSNRGLCGLSNLGNTCFMNSALQCLSNTTELSKYFLYGLYKDEINYKNALGTQGRLVAAYAKLMKEMWVDSDRKTAPWDVKKSIGKVAQQFSGFAQQDSYELFNYLVDTLHEDLNRVIDKPYVETEDSNDRSDDIVSKMHWESFTARNRSVIVDLMYGQLKSRLICQTCSSVSNTFDPFLALSVPIPKPTSTKVKVVYYPLSLQGESSIKTIKVQMKRGETGKELKEKIIDMVKLPESQKLYVMKTMNRGADTEKMLKQDAELSEFSEIKICAYAFEDISAEKKEKTFVQKLLLSQESKTYYASTGDLCPPINCFLQTSDMTFSQFRQYVFSRIFPLIQESIPTKIDDELKKFDHYQTKVEKAWELLEKEGEIENLYKLYVVKPKKYQYSSYNEKEPEMEFDDEDNFAEILKKSKGDVNGIRIKFPKHVDLVEEKLPPKEKASYYSEPNEVSLDDCLSMFSSEELLTNENQVYCRKCKEHRDTFKKMDVYTLPNILIIQLKRFSKDQGGVSGYGGMGMRMSMMSSSKNSDKIDFPIEGLDMTQYVLDPHTGESNIYDLYAISNHMGSLYGGHYTAHCKNSLDGEWYSFNDSSVGRASANNLVDPSAYVLFYRRRNISFEQGKTVDVEALD